MKKCMLWSLILLLFSGCAAAPSETAPGYVHITPHQAKAMLDKGECDVLLDVRTQKEYDSVHIPGATVLPYTQITDQAEIVIPDKNAVILVYCRSGHRSQLACRALAELGYTKVYDFGGIQDWPFETE